MLFRDVIGQNEIKASLIKTVQEGRISHAQLFGGEEGSGGLPLALAYARYIACENKNDEDSCGECSTCKKFDIFQFADLHFSYPFFNQTTGGSNAEEFIVEWRTQLLKTPYFDLNTWRNSLAAENKQLTIGVKESARLIEKLNLTAYEGGYKFVIIWMPEFMRVDSANKLLKIIEEPPKDTLFLLVSKHPENLISTITSRTQMIQLPKIDSDEIENALITRHKVVSIEHVKQLTEFANGDYLKATQQLVKNEADEQRLEQFTEWMRNCYLRDIAWISSWSDTMHKSGRENIKGFLDLSLEIVRQCIYSNYTESKILVPGLSDNFIGKFSAFINEKNIHELTEEMNMAHFDISRNVYGKLVLLDLSLTVHKLLRK